MRISTTQLSPTNKNPQNLILQKKSPVPLCISQEAGLWLAETRVSRLLSLLTAVLELFWVRNWKNRQSLLLLKMGFPTVSTKWALLPATLVKADLPVHCLRHQITGEWEFTLGPLSETRSSCGHAHPDDQNMEPQLHTLGDGPTSTMKVMPDGVVLDVLVLPHRGGEHANADQN